MGGREKERAGLNLENGGRGPKIWGGGGKCPPGPCIRSINAMLERKIEEGEGVYSTVEPLMWTLVGQKKVS